MACCPYCNSQLSTLRYHCIDGSNHEYFLHNCQGCECAYLNPAPSEEELLKAYDDVYYGSGKKKFSGIFGVVFDFLQYRRLSNYRKHLPDNAKIIDIGCGSGTFASALINAGYECTGVELPGAAAKRAAKIDGLDLRVGEFLNAELPEAYYDMAVMWHVIEHLRKPKEALKEMVRVVKSGGMVVLALPNLESSQSRLFGGNWLHLDPPRHLHFPSRKLLEKELAELGCCLIYKNYWSLEYNPFGIQQSLLNAFSKERDVLFEVLKGNKELVKSYGLTYRLGLLAYFFISAPIAIGIALIESLLSKGGCMTLVFRKN